MSILEVRGLNKRFKDVTAIKDLNLDIDKGEIFGLIGPDGAGKTAFLRLLTGIILPTTGTIKCCGVNIPSDAEEAKPKVGIMPQNFSLYRDLTVEENLQFFAEMYGVEKNAFMERKNRLLNITKLRPFMRRRAENLSGGMQKKLALISALLHNPDLLLLDEPTTGVDPVSRRELWDFFYDLLKSGITIVVSTPYMDEAEKCSRVGFLYQGSLLLIERPDIVKGNYPYAIIEVSGADKPSISTKGLPPEVIDLYPVAQTLHLVVERGSVRKVHQFFDHFASNLQLVDIEPSFEDVFVATIKK